MSQRDGDRLVLDDAICRLYFLMADYGVPLSRALDVFGRRVVLQWLRIARCLGSNEQRMMAARVVSVTELADFLRQWPYAPIHFALCHGWVKWWNFGLLRFWAMQGSRAAYVRKRTQMRAAHFLNG